MARNWVAVLTAAVLLSACSAGQEDAGRSDPPATAAPEAPADEGAALDGGGGTPTGPIVDGRSIAVTASVTMEANDIELAVQQVTVLVQRRGGAVFDANVQLGDRDGWATLTVKLPPAELDTVVAGLADYGTVRSRTQETEDVTEQLVDLESRIATMRASVARVRALLADAKQISDIVTIEAELTWRETELERLLAQQRNLEQRVETTTLFVEIRSRSLPDDDGTTIGEALADGWSAFVAVLRGIVLVLAYLVPFVGLAALGVGGAVLVRRRVRRGHASPTE